MIFSPFPLPGRSFEAATFAATQRWFYCFIADLILLFGASFEDEEEEDEQQNDPGEFYSPSPFLISLQSAVHHTFFNYMLVLARISGDRS